MPNPAWGEDKHMTFYMDKRDENRPDDEYLKKYPCLGQKASKPWTPDSRPWVVKSKRISKASKS